MKAANGNSQVAVIDRVHKGLAEMDALVEARLERAAQTEHTYGAFLPELLESEVVDGGSGICGPGCGWRTCPR